MDLGFTTIDGGKMREMSSLYQEMIALAAHMDERYDGFKVRLSAAPCASQATRSGRRGGSVGSGVLARARCGVESGLAPTLDVDNRPRGTGSPLWRASAATDRLWTSTVCTWRLPHGIVAPRMVMVEWSWSNGRVCAMKDLWDKYFQPYISDLKKEAFEHLLEQGKNIIIPETACEGGRCAKLREGDPRPSSLALSHLFARTPWRSLRRWPPRCVACCSAGGELLASRVRQRRQGGEVDQAAAQARV